MTGIVYLMYCRHIFADKSARNAIKIHFSIEIFLKTIFFLLSLLLVGVVDVVVFVSVF